MNRAQLFVMASGLTLAAVAASLAWRPVAPIDTPYFQWRPSGESYDLVVSHVEGNPEFRQGVATTPVPRSGALRVRGQAGAAEPGALVEVSNPRTGEGYAATADATGAFAIEAQARRGDELKVISRKIEFRRLEPPGYSSSALSSP
jgi:hypothetical protein